jgi:hypothetical protein
MAFRQNTFEVWCYIRKRVGKGYQEKEWKVCNRKTEPIAREHAATLQKRQGYGEDANVNSNCRRYFVKVIST